MVKSFSSVILVYPLCILESHRTLNLPQIFTLNYSHLKNNALGYIPREIVSNSLRLSYPKPGSLITASQQQSTQLLFLCVFCSHICPFFCQLREYKMIVCICILFCWLVLFLFQPNHSINSFYIFLFKSFYFILPF